MIGGKAQIERDGKNTNLGRFDEEREAAKAYNVAAEAYFGEYAVLNELGT